MSAFPTLAITGGTGFVGTHLIRLARERGHRVRALTRSDRSDEDGLAWVAGTLEQPESLAFLCAGADGIIHLAGAINAASRAGFASVNAGGTAAIIEAACRTGVRRFIHISSLSAREPALSDYGWSKARSEEIVAASGLDWTIVRPPAIYGPGDRETLELFRMARRGLVALPPGGRFSVIHVDDLCRLILDAVADAGSLSQCYEPDDGAAHGWAHRDFAHALGRAFGRKVIALPIPRLAMLGAAHADRWVRGAKAKLTPDRARYFCHPDWVAAPDRRPPAGLWSPQIPTPEGLRATADWYRQAGWIR